MIGAGQRLTHLIRASHIASATARRWSRTAGRLALLSIRERDRGADRVAAELARRAIARQELAIVAQAAARRLFDSAKAARS